MCSCFCQFYFKVSCLMFALWQSLLTLHLMLGIAGNLLSTRVPYINLFSLYFIQYHLPSLLCWYTLGMAYTPSHHVIATVKAWVRPVFQDFFSQEFLFFNKSCLYCSSNISSINKFIIVSNPLINGASMVLSGGVLPRSTKLFGKRSLKASHK